MLWANTTREDFEQLQAKRACRIQTCMLWTPVYPSFLEDKGLFLRQNKGSCNWLVTGFWRRFFLYLETAGLSCVSSSPAAQLGTQSGAGKLQVLSLTATPQSVTPSQGQGPRLAGRGTATALEAWVHFFPTWGFSRSHQRWGTGSLIRVCEGKNSSGFEA